MEVEHVQEGHGAVSSPYPRHSCPKCNAPLSVGLDRCPQCGYRLSRSKLSNGCVVALIVAVGFPLLAFGGCMLVFMDSYTNPSAGELFIVYVFVAPALILAVISWLAVRNRKP